MKPNEKILGLTEDEIRNCGYATHLPILDFLLDEIKPKKTLEWGMGFYSTPLLREKSGEVHSIETGSEEWFQKVDEKYTDDTSLVLYRDISESGALGFLQPMLMDCKWDLIFNDGDANSRHIVAQTCQFKDNVVISHDTQEKQYFYNTILLGEGWQWIDIMDYSVWTSVMSNNPEIIQKLSDKFEKTKVYTGTGLFHKDFTHDHGRAL